MQTLRDPCIADVCGWDAVPSEVVMHVCGD